MGDGQQELELVAGGREQRCWFKAEALEALFIGLMAPAQQLLKMHDASSIRFTKTDTAAQH